jgi:glycosyltransferase involved in cell wall biosynthesis
MRIGLVARADNTGLGNQTYEFYKHMKPDKTMVVDIGHLNGNVSHLDRYPNAQVVQGFPKSHNINEFLADLDVVFVAESPYNYWLYERARELGVKVAVQYNYEFFDWYSHPNLPTPDMLIAPSRWHYEQIQEFCDARHIEHVYLHCPVNRELLPLQVKTEAKKFLHIAGKPAAFDRNGTETVLDAVEHINEDVEIYVTVQSPKYLDEWIKRGKGNPKLHFFDTSLVDDYAKLYENMDVLLLPRRYGGNCLPLNEALSTGMPVIMPDLSPNNHLLPPSWLLPAQKVGEFKPRMIVDIYGVNPMLLAEKIDELARRDDMADQSLIADAIAKQIDWKVMEPMYREALEGLCQK